MVAHPAVVAAASISASVCPLDVEGLMRRANTPRHCTQQSLCSSSFTSLPSLRFPPSPSRQKSTSLPPLGPSLACAPARSSLARRLWPPSRATELCFFGAPPNHRKRESRTCGRAGRRGSTGREGSPREAVTASARALLINDCRRRVARLSLRRPSLRQSITVPLAGLGHVPAVRASVSAANVFSPAAAAARLLPLEGSDSDPNPRSQSTTHARPLYPSLRPRHTRSLHRR